MKSPLMMIALVLTSLSGLSSVAHARAAPNACGTRAWGYNISGATCTNVGYTDRYGDNTYICSGGGSTWALYSAGDECHAQSLTRASEQ